MGESILQYIDQAVAKALAAGRLSVAQGQKDAYKTTERRLYALPVIRAKLEEEREELAQLTEDQELSVRSTDIIRFQRPGLRLSKEDILTARITDLECRIASKEHEIKEMERALEQVTNDYYYLTISLKYFDSTVDEEAAAILHCDPSTIRRNRSRLVRIIAVWLYGPEAI